MQPAFRKPFKHRATPVRVPEFAVMVVDQKTITGCDAAAEYDRPKGLFQAFTTNDAHYVPWEVPQFVLWAPV